MYPFQQVFSCFPEGIQKQLLTLDPYTKQKLEEIRVYKNKEIQIFAQGKRLQLAGKIHGQDIQKILNQLMKFSYYAYEEDLAKGFITIDGGHRVGICGKAVMEKGKIILLREISSLNIRQAKEIIGCSDAIMHEIMNNKLQNLLIAAPPGCGKTTLLRDIARNLSQRYFKVAICDERSEIAGMHGGVSPYQFGPMVDVLDGCPKAEGMMMLIRSMSPDVIIADELGRPEDLDAIKTCMHCGVRIITTIHGSDLQDLQRSAIYPAIESGVFPNIIFLTDQPQVGTIKEVIHG